MKSALDINLFFSQATEAGTDSLAGVQRCLIVAPHPDDETLGCGGLIARLRQARRHVQVIFTTDGSMSHPNSVQFPVSRRIAVRREEAMKALAILGVEAGDIFFLNGKDSHLPGRDMDGFTEMMQTILQRIRRFDPQMILVPYEQDPHCDHRATWQLVHDAVSVSGKAIRIWEYPIWLYELAAEADVPLLGSGDLKYVDTLPFLALKKCALDQHQSQITQMIDDDPEGFILEPHVIIINHLRDQHQSQITQMIDDDPEGFILEPHVIEHFMTGREYFIERSL